MISVVNLRLVFFLLSSLLLAGCLAQKKTPDSLKEIKGEVFGSYFIVKYYGDLEKEKFNSTLYGH